MKSPLLTICLLTHNSEKYLEKTLESLLAQTYSNFEIIISDNQSTDRTLKIIEEFKKQNPKIVFRQNILDIKPGKFYDGCYSNCNGCIKSGLIKGEFVSFCHSDDIYEKSIMEEEVAFLIKFPDAGAIFTRVHIIDKNDKKIGSSKLPNELKGKDAHNFTEIFNSLLKHGNTFMATPTFMARKKVIDEMGLFSYEETFKTSADLEMWLRILEKYTIGIINKKLANYRTGGGGTTNKFLREERSDFFSTMDYYLKKIGSQTKLDEKLLRQYNYQKDFDNTLRAINFLIKGDIQKAKELINFSFSWKFFIAFIENMSILRTKVLLLKIILFLGINLRLGKFLGKILYKLI